MGTESRDPTTRTVFGDGDFSVKSATCINAFQLYFSPGFHSTAAGCPFIERTKGRYTLDNLKVRCWFNSFFKINKNHGSNYLFQQFRVALISAIKETLGDNLSAEAKQAFQNAYAVADARKKP